MITKTDTQRFVFSNGSYQDFPNFTNSDAEVVEKSDHTPIIPDIKSEIEYRWAASELSLADIEINKHLDSDESAIATEEEWRTYRKDLRAYATVTDGVYSYEGDRPTAPEQTT